MDENDELARELMSLLPQSGYKIALGVGDAAGEKNEEGMAFDDFFLALNAFRAARASGDAHAEAEAEEQLREVVRDELRRGGC